MTALWWEQRETCRRCAHHSHEISSLRAQSYGERCLATQMREVFASPEYTPVHVPLKYTRRGRHLTGVAAYCIDARLPGTPCGPEARLFAPRSVISDCQ